MMDEQEQAEEQLRGWFSEHVSHSEDERGGRARPAAIGACDQGVAGSSPRPVAWLMNVVFGGFVCMRTCLERRWLAPSVAQTNLHSVRFGWLVAGRSMQLAYVRDLVGQSPVGVCTWLGQMLRFKSMLGGLQATSLRSPLR